MTNKKTLKLASGQELDSKFVNKVDLKKHTAALKLIKKAKDMQARMIAFKQETITLCDALNDDLRKAHNIKERTNSRGGYTVGTLDKQQQIQFKIGSRIEFDERIDLAKLKFFEFIEEKTSDGEADLKLLIETAFSTSRGQLDPKKITQLLPLKINHPTWKEAIDLLTMSMSSNTTKRYIEFREKDQEGNYQTIVLDFASL
jgi:hypothetical protein